MARPLLILAALSALSGSATAAGQPSPVALGGGTLIDPRGAPVTNASVVVRNGRIVCAGTRSNCPAPPDARIVDVSGKFITAGLIDAHVHYSQTGWVDGRPDAVDLRAEFPYDSTVASLQRNTAPFDRAWLCSGVTAVFDVGGFPFTIPMAQAHESQTLAPRMAAAGPLLSSRAHWLNLPFTQQFVPMTGDSIVRAAVLGIGYMGASALKVWYLQLPDSLQPHARDMLMIAGQTAKQAGLPMIVHATQLPRAKEALAAGTRVGATTIEAGNVELRVRTAWLGISKERVIRATEIARLELHSGMQRGDQVWYDLRVHLVGGRKRRSARGLGSDNPGKVS